METCRHEPPDYVSTVVPERQDRTAELIIVVLGWLKMFYPAIDNSRPLQSRVPVEHRNGKDGYAAGLQDTICLPETRRIIGDVLEDF